MWLKRRARPNSTISIRGTTCGQSAPEFSKRELLALGGLFSAVGILEAQLIDVPFVHRVVCSFQQACSKFFESAEGPTPLLELDLTQLTDALVVANFFMADCLYETLLRCTALKLIQLETTTNYRFA